MDENELFYATDELVNKVRYVAKQFDCHGDLFDDEQRQWRDPSHDERCAFIDTFREVARHYVLSGESREFVKRLVWNSVMNSDMVLEKNKAEAYDPHYQILK